MGVTLSTSPDYCWSVTYGGWGRDEADSGAAWQRTSGLDANPAVRLDVSPGDLGPGWGKGKKADSLRE